MPQKKPRGKKLKEKLWGKKETGIVEWGVYMLKKQLDSKKKFGKNVELAKIKGPHFFGWNKAKREILVDFNIQ